MNELLESCPVCHSADLRQKLQVQDKSVSQEVFTIQQCRGCDLLFTNPRPDAASIAPYYESATYVSHNSKAQGVINQAYKLARYFTTRHKVRLITQLNYSRPGRLLDYGCGTGHFLAQAQAAGWQVTGLEPNATARREAAARTRQRIGEPGELAALPAASFEVVTLWHVLEHVHALDATLTELRRVLRPGGQLLLAVPNAASADAHHYGADWAAYDVPRHLYHFTPPAMRELLTRHQLRITKQLPMALDAYYVSLLSEGLRGQGFGPVAALRTGLRSNRQAERNGQYSSLLYVAERP